MFYHCKFAVGYHIKLTLSVTWKRPYNLLFWYLLLENCQQRLVSWYLYYCIIFFHVVRMCNKYACHYNVILILLI